MINRLLSTTAIATVIGISLLSPESAKASTLKLLDNLSYDGSTKTFTGDAGSYQTRYDVQPGVYGVEVRSGKTKINQDWQLGVGTQTSNSGTFSEKRGLEWLNPDPDPDNDNIDNIYNIYDFSINWEVGSKVTANIGDEEVSYEADWEMGNAIQFLVKRQSYLLIEEVDGVTFDYEVNQLEENINSWTNIFVTGDTLEDGWQMTGKIAMTPNGGSSKHGVIVKMGDFTGGVQSVPEPSTIFGSLVALAFGFRLRKVN
ncbi:MAG: PEP-CTERM sorting domain-containing protein [Trichodesmium sp. MO_231.B1]|nr:PEP-CTERM sorting domain-containing protein [Trichodesmium sp. MO_231.B1]